MKATPNDGTIGDKKLPFLNFICATVTNINQNANIYDANNNKA